MLELGTFISGVLFGLCQLCHLHADKPEKISEMAHRLRVGTIYTYCLAFPPWMSAVTILCIKIIKHYKHMKIHLLPCIPAIDLSGDVLALKDN